jgi:hypothetical protein
MALNLAQALGILVQSAQAHLNGELLTSEPDRKLLTESVNLLMQTEEELEKEKHGQQPISGDGSAGESSSNAGEPLADPAI